MVECTRELALETRGLDDRPGPMDKALHPSRIIALFKPYDVLSQFRGATGRTDSRILVRASCSEIIL